MRQFAGAFYIRSRRIWGPSGLWDGAVHVDGGRIRALVTVSQIPSGAEVVDYGELVVFPGLVDTHAHINEPGRTEWEGFETATRAAAAGGVTSVIDMPLNSIPPTTTVKGLEAKAQSAKGHCWIDYGFWGGVIPGNDDELEPMLRAGARGFKAFLIESGVPEFPWATADVLRRAMSVLVRAGVPLLVHAERAGKAPELPAGDRTYGGFLASRPRDWENEAIREMIALCRETRCPVHVVHLSSSEALEDIRHAKDEGLPFTAETCPHYLVFAAEEIPDGATHFKCCPPIRERENRESLWDGLRRGTIDFIVSDHSPCTPGLKAMDSGDFQKAWGGISSLQFGLPVIWTELKRRGYSLEDLARWMAAGTARFARLARKGSLAPGNDADIVVWDPEASTTVGARGIFHRHGLTPYGGRPVFGTVEGTYVRGIKVYEGGGAFGPPAGERL